MSTFNLVLEVDLRLLSMDPGLLLGALVESMLYGDDNIISSAVQVLTTDGFADLPNPPTGEDYNSIMANCVRVGTSISRQLDIREVMLEVVDPWVSDVTPLGNESVILEFSPGSTS